MKVKSDFSGKTQEGNIKKYRRVWGNNSSSRKEL